MSYIPLMYLPPLMYVIYRKWVYLLTAMDPRTYIFLTAETTSSRAVAATRSDCITHNTVRSCNATTSSCILSGTALLSYPTISKFTTKDVADKRSSGSEGYQNHASNPLVGGQSNPDYPPRKVMGSTLCALLRGRTQPRGIIPLAQEEAL